MSLIVAIQMDPMEGIDIEADSTFALAMEAQARGHRLYHYLPRDMALNGGRVVATARGLEVRAVVGDHFTLGEPETLDLAIADVVLMRQDPPFDMAYITATHLLEHIHPKTLVVNDPVQVRNAPEKIRGSSTIITVFPLISSAYAKFFAGQIPISISFAVPHARSGRLSGATTKCVAIKNQKTTAPSMRSADPLYFRQGPSARYWATSAMPPSPAANNMRFEGNAAHEGMIERTIPAAQKRAARRSRSSGHSASNRTAHKANANNQSPQYSGGGARK